MSKTYFWLIDIIIICFLSIITLLSYISYIYSDIDYNYINKYDSNWETGPISDIIKANDNNTCPDEYSLLISSSFPGTNEGCDCRYSTNKNYKYSIYNRKCLYYHIADNCTMIFPIEPMQIVNWRKENLCVKRMKRTYWDILSSEIVLRNNETCPIGYKKCGKIDTFSNILCMEYRQDCPLNQIIISDKDNPKFNRTLYKSIELTFENKAIYYSNHYINSSIIVEIDLYMNNLSCSSSVEGNFLENSFILNKIQSVEKCLTKIDEKYSDDRYIYLDSIPISLLLEFNNLTKIINFQREYSIYNNHSNAYMNSISYFGINYTCLANYNIDYNSIIIHSSNINIIKTNLISLLFFCLFTLISFLFFGFVYKILLSKLSISPKIQISFDSIVLLFILIIVLSSIIIHSNASFIIEPYIDFRNKLCGEENTLYSLYMSYYKLEKVCFYSFLIVILGFFEIVLIFVHYCYYFKFCADPLKADIKYN